MPVQAAHEGGEVGCVCAWDLSCGREVLQAERLAGPRVIREDVADPSHLGTGEHGAVMVAEGAGLGPQGRACEMVEPCQDGPA